MNWTISKILKDPQTYIIRVFDFFMASHSKFAFEHDIKPLNWDLNFNDNMELNKFSPKKLIHFIISPIHFYLVKPNIGLPYTYVYILVA